MVALIGLAIEEMAYDSAVHMLTSAERNWLVKGMELLCEGVTFAAVSRRRGRLSLQYKP
ncbi:hypothetical protein [Massilia pseudoviolaceinigra]|uniref:hypothetical protein n=1 Tax=Massilia pseudoviolaceinigra TaxID=3057165 RepID=UPI002796C3F1|nr:hypothetical protein [Massilia sp. CCM 9206]MDQ1923943.1 hypothetical protein [Massilia sp. CCM 9206]